MAKKRVMTETSNLFIVWNPFQRRSETLAAAFDLDLLYYNYRWERKGAFFKTFSYLPKFLETMYTLVRKKPRYVFVQLAPTPLLYVASLYRLVSGAKIVADCHNTMIYDDHWIHWPFAKSLLRRADIALVHNRDVEKLARELNIDTLILRDPLPVLKVPAEIHEVAGIDIRNQSYVIIPCGIAPDEPVDALFGAIRAMPDQLFVMTWFADKLSPEVRNKAPDNLRFSGYLNEPEFNALYANANAALVLTTREGTQPSGAAEAISLGVPLILSDLATTMSLYGDAPVYVQNDIAAIAAGTAMALSDYDRFSRAISGLREALREDADGQIARLKSVLSEWN